ncbi:cytidine deaminase [Sediminibacterium roseum]|uniref:Cytidine deaminase n=1 Tax=Sediminibacterium roseum TaxID=1978412 RepID=A0ABW9ZVM4_9BACT|nr:cytidine deaminase [Sediminibacterium roseum]NCI51206.1 cytidine deaminase [Sediminibacterium roseum]
MQPQQLSISYTAYESREQLDAADAALLQRAIDATNDAYAPYSHFRVGAAALLENGEVVLGSNQENASYPVGLCAERVLLSAVSSVYPNVPIKTMAITYRSESGKSNRPISPCGVCRQTLVEYENRLKQPIRLILGGMDGKIWIIPQAGSLLPFGFSGEDLL